MRSTINRLIAMSRPDLPTDVPIMAFRTAVDFETFLDREHKVSPGIWLKMAKKSAQVPSISAAEGIEVALCYGWINGQGRRFDDDWTLSRYTPRRPKSTWSKINVDIADRLIEAGRMRPAGAAAIEAAKADGRWGRAYASPSTIQVPDDFAGVLADATAASTTFRGMNKTSRYLLLLRLQNGAPKNRQRLMDTLVSELAEGKIPVMSRATAKTSDEPAVIVTEKPKPLQSSRVAKSTASSGRTHSRRPGLRSQKPDS